MGLSALPKSRDLEMEMGVGLGVAQGGSLSLHGRAWWKLKGPPQLTLALRIQLW